MNKLTLPKLTTTAVAESITLLIWFVTPAPDKVSPDAWHLLALFIGTIAVITGKAIPIGALSIVAISLVAITEVTRPGKPEGAIVDALIVLLVMPLVLYFLFPPEIKNTPNAKEFAQSELTKLGPMKVP